MNILKQETVKKLEEMFGRRATLETLTAIRLGNFKIRANESGKKELLCEVWVRGEDKYSMINYTRLILPAEYFNDPSELEFHKWYNWKDLSDFQKSTLIGKQVILQDLDYDMIPCIKVKRIVKTNSKYDSLESENGIFYKPKMKLMIVE